MNARTLAEDLFPAAAALFRDTPPAEPREAVLRWLAVLAGLGVAIMVGRRVVGWMDRNL